MLNKRTSLKNLPSLTAAAPGGFLSSGGFMNWKPIVALLVLVPIIDFLWIGFLGKSFYIEGLAEIGRIEGGSFKPVLWAALVVYVLIAVGIPTFVLPKAEGLAGATAYGGLFGLVMYGVYDMTNYATLAKYPLSLTLLDMSWGTILCACGGAIGFWVQGLG